MHGAFSTTGDYRAVGDVLATDYQVVLVERRGYESASFHSTDGTFTQDGEDVAAVLDYLDRPVLLFGHSAGALVVMEAIRAARAPVRGLVLYEPADSAPAALLDRFRALRAAGDPAAAIAAFIASDGGPPEEELVGTLRQPAWAERLLLANGVERDLAAQVAYTDATDWSGLDFPVKVLVGAQTTGTPRRRAEMLAKSLPNAELVTLPGQGHLANMLAPELLAAAIVRADRSTTYR